jgi:hypothetical protein
MKPITRNARKKFKRWNDAVDKLSENNKREEAESWIIAALNILKENETNNVQDIQ